jgi:uncharacterized protein YvpB
MLDVPFVSQLENVLPEYGCGIACLMMLLKFHCRRRRCPTYDELAKDLRAEKLPSEKGYTWYSDVWGRGAYVDDVCLWLLQKRFVFTAANHKSARSERTLFGVLTDTPAMVGMKWHDIGHWVVIVGFDKEYVTLLDPNRLPSGRFKRRVSRARFVDEWDGAAIALVGSY